MRNTLAIADKELRSYFASPIAYILIGLFSLLFGWFFYVYLMAFNQQSQQMMQFGQGGGANINQMMIRGLFQNTAVIILFMMPMITMRTYSEEKRSGTIELLLTSPVTDLEIILGKFLGALALYAAMLLVTMLYMVMLFKISNPGVAADRGGIPGAAADGRLLPLDRPLHLEPDQEPDRRRLPDLRHVPDALDRQLDRRIVGTDDAGDVLTYLSITEHFDDFARGIIDTKHVVYYLSFITFGLFLTAKSVDSERWRG